MSGSWREASLSDVESTTSIQYKASLAIHGESSAILLTHSLSSSRFKHRVKVEAVHRLHPVLGGQPCVERHRKERRPFLL